MAEHRYFIINDSTNKSYVYRINIIKIKNKSFLKPGIKPEDFFAKVMVTTLDKGNCVPKLINYDTLIYKNRYAINQKIDFMISFKNEKHEQYNYNLVFSLDTVIVSIGIITPPNDESQLITNGFLTQLK